MAKITEFQDGDIIQAFQNEMGIFSAYGIYTKRDDTKADGDLMTLINYDGGRPCERAVPANHVKKIASGNYIDYLLKTKFNIEKNTDLSEINMLSRSYFLGRLISNVRNIKPGRWILDNRELMEPQTNTFFLTGYYPGMSSFSSEIIKVFPRLPEEDVENFLKENYPYGIGNLKRGGMGSKFQSYQTLCLPYEALPLVKDSIVL